MSTVSIDVVSAGPGPALKGFRDALKDEIVAETVGHMVTQITLRLGKPNSLKRLRIFGHGKPGCAVIGEINATLTLDSNEQIEKKGGNTQRAIYPVTYQYGNRTVTHIMNEYELRLLRPYFIHGGWVELHHCHVAEGQKGRDLLLGLAKIFGTLVKGGEGKQFLGGGIENRAVIAYPNGRIDYRRGS